MSAFQELRKRLQKPERGAHDIERKLARRAIETFEEAQKTIARRRDGYRTRWPSGNPLKLRLEVAHYKSKGMGGDHGRRSSSRDLITLTYLDHQGTRSIHSGHKRIVPLDKEKRMAGPCEFYERDDLRKPWRLVGREVAVGVLEKL